MKDNAKSLKSLVIAKLFSSFNFSILMSSLVLSLSGAFHMSERFAVDVVGVFLGLHFCLPVLTGFLGNRWVSFKTLFCIGLPIQALGYGLLGVGASQYLDIALAMVLMGGMVNSVSIVVFISHLTEGDDLARRRAMLHNYAGMNVGFVLGYVVAGWVGVHGDYLSLFRWTAVLPVISVCLVHRYVDYSPINVVRYSKSLCVVFFAVMLLLVWQVLLRVVAIRYPLLLLPVAAILYLLYVSGRLHGQERINLVAFVFYMLISILFWSIALMMPTVITLLIHHQGLLLWGNLIAPQWVTMLNSLILVVAAPMLSRLHLYLRQRFDYALPTAYLFAMAMFFVAIGLYVMTLVNIPIVEAVIVFIVAVTLGELLSNPEGYGLPAKLTPLSMRGFTSGAWISTLGVASVVSTLLTDRIFSVTARLSHLVIHDMFSDLAWVSLFAALFVLVLAGLYSDKPVKKLVQSSV